MPPAREIISAKELTIEAGGRTLLEHASFSFDSSTRAAIVGANGSGKSTLLKALARNVEPVSGCVAILKGAVVEYVPQFVPEELRDLTAIEVLQKKIQETRPSVEEWKANEIISRFGLDDIAYNIPLGDVSGGEANRIMLARTLVVQPDFILLDEPTNHLDIEATVAFEKLVKEELATPFCIVSHDRELLDSCTQQTFVLRDQQLYRFGFSYTKAREALADEDIARAQRRKSEEKEIQKLKKSADRLRSWVRTNSDLAATHRSMRKRIDRMEASKTDVSRERYAKVALGGVSINTKSAIRIVNFDVTTPDGTQLYHIESLTLSPGDRIALFGRNGAGKTTLLRAIVQNFEVESIDKHMKFNPQVTLGYFDQELALLDPNDSLFDHVSKNSSATNDVIRSTLITAGFPYDRLNQKIGPLSGGEKARLQFATLKLTHPNVLLLDEPTNHIDVDGIELLEEQIEESDSTFVMVSHDRRFIDRIANRFLLVADGKLREIGGSEDYYEYILSTDRVRTVSKPTAAVEQVSKVLQLSGEVDLDSIKGDALIEAIEALEVEIAGYKQGSPEHDELTARMERYFDALSD